MQAIRSNPAAQPDPAMRRGQVLTSATLKAAEVLGITQAQLGQIIGVSAPTVSRMKSGDYTLSEERKEWSLAALLVRLYRSLDSMVGVGARKTPAPGSPAPIAPSTTRRRRNCWPMCRAWCM